MKSRDEVIAILRNAMPSIQKRWPVVRLSLFGSVARGEQTSKSDVDLLVELSAPMGWDFFDLTDEVERLLGSKVDLVTRNTIKPKAWQYIANEVIDV